MQNKYFLAPLAVLLLLAAAPRLAHAQATGSVGIGTTAPDASAALDIVSSSKGALLPRLTQAQVAAIATPATGLLVFQTDGTPGFYYNAGAPASPTWQLLGGGGDNLGNHTATTNLLLGSNLLTGTGGYTGTVRGIGVRTDGGLDIGQNTAGNGISLGYQSGRVNTAGTQNLLVGYQSGTAITSGSRNQFLGYQSGAAVTAANNNQFLGYQSGRTNTGGTQNQFSGYQSGLANTGGSYNQFSGYQSGQANTFGTQNQFSGYQSGYSNTTGNYNQFDGYQSGRANTTGKENQFSGYQSGLVNTTGSFNQFSGVASGTANTTGANNMFNGYESGFSNTTGSFNFFSGYNSGRANTTGIGNHFDGYRSGLSNTQGGANHFSGYNSGLANTTGSHNQFVGVQSGYSNTTGDDNQFSGYFSGQANTTGARNQFDGNSSGFSNTTGSQNQFSGYSSGVNNTTGSNNQFSGYNSGLANTTGAQNLFVGYASGVNNLTGSNNTALGANSGPDASSPALTNATAVGANVALTQSNTLVLGSQANVGIGTTGPTQKLDVRGNLRLGDDGGQVAGTGQAIEFVGPGFSTDPVGVYRVNPASDQSELRVVVGDVPDPNDKFVVGRMAGTNAEGGIPTGTFTPTFSVNAAGQVNVPGLAGTGARVLTADASGTLTTATGLSVDAAGNSQLPAANAYTYAAPKTYSVTYGASDWQPESGAAANAKVLSTSGGDDSMNATSNTGALRVPLHLPQGAVVTSLTVFYLDATRLADFTVSLRVLTVPPAAFPVLSTAVSFTTSGEPGRVTTDVPLPTPLVIDNANSCYLRVAFNQVNSALTLSALRVNYTVTQAE